METRSRPLRFYGDGVPYLKSKKVTGRLIVVEGPDSSGRSTQIQLLTAKLEADGHAVLNTGLRRSELIGEGIMRAKGHLGTGVRTIALFYVADFADQLENKIIPALEAGYLVLADRYIFTLIARNIVRGMERRWCHSIFGFAVVPDLVFYLDVKPAELVHRVFQKNSSLDYYESGMDIGLSDNMFESFIMYQEKIRREFSKLQKEYSLVPIDANRSVSEVNLDLENRIGSFLKMTK